jgi:hypothetical protein
MEPGACSPAAAVTPKPRQRQTAPDPTARPGQQEGGTEALARCGQPPSGSSGRNQDSQDSSLARVPGAARDVPAPCDAPWPAFLPQWLAEAGAIHFAKRAQA